MDHELWMMVEHIKCLFLAYIKPFTLPVNGFPQLVKALSLFNIRTTIEFDIF